MIGVERLIPDILLAIAIVLYLSTFWLVNLYNLIKSRQQGSSQGAFAEIRSPGGLLVALSGGGTLIFFVLMIGFAVLVFTGFEEVLHFFPFQIWIHFDWIIQIAGVVVLGTGWFLFLWSVVVRGQFSVAWKMTANHQLVTWGPYRYIRHPSYMGYFLMFLGFFLLWLNLIALLPLIAIPGYVRISASEEELLAKRFGDEYRKYQQQTGKFVPRFRK